MVRLLTPVAVLVLVAGCGVDYWAFSSSTSGPNPGSTLVVVWVSDSPVDDADALEISVARVEAVGAEGVEPLSEDVGTYDLLLLQNGARAKLAEGTIATGTYTGLRLTLVTHGPRTPRMRRDGVWVPLALASPTAHVVEIPYRFEAPDQDRIEIHVDFNARLSVRETPLGLELAPVLDALDPRSAGSIQGRVTGPLGGGMPDAVVVARRGGLEIRSTRSRADGTFTLGPLAPGTYEVLLQGPVGPLDARPGIDVASGATVTVDLRPDGR